MKVRDASCRIVQRFTRNRYILPALVVGIMFTSWLLSCQGSALLHGSVKATTTLNENGAGNATNTTVEAVLPGSSLVPSVTIIPFLAETVMPTVQVSTPTLDGLQSYSRTQYVIVARLDYAAHHLIAELNVTYVNSSSESLHDLFFVVEANRQPGVFHLTGLRWSDGRSLEGYTLEDAGLRVPLPTPLLPDDQITISLNFELDLPCQPGILGYTERQTNLCDWFPIVPPYIPGQGWLVHEPATVGEHMVYDVADFQVDFQLMSQSKDLTIAASAIAKTDEDWYRYQLDAARTFVVSVSPEYQVISEPVGPVTVLAYVFPEDLAAGEAALDAAVDALQFYSQLFYPYLHEGLAIVEADFFDGMEYDGMVFIDRRYLASYPGEPKGYHTAITVHEISHQWWYGLVGNDQATEPWLDEALATYCELLFYEQFHPELIDWWWYFRVTRFAPSGWVDSTIYEFIGFRSYVNAVYLRGVMFIQDLRNLIGDKAFFALLQGYAMENAHGHATADSFFHLMDEYSSVDLSELREEYFRYRE